MKNPTELSPEQEPILAVIAANLKKHFPSDGNPIKQIMDIQDASTHLLAQQIAVCTALGKNREDYLKNRLELLVVLVRKYEDLINKRKEQ